MIGNLIEDLLAGADAAAEKFEDMTEEELRAEARGHLTAEEVAKMAIGEVLSFLIAKELNCAV